MTTLLLLTLTGLGVGALYFLVASGLSLIFGLMDVLNLAHGAFITIGAYGAWLVSTELLGWVENQTLRFILAAAMAIACSVAVAILVERVFIRRFYGQAVPQVLITLGLLLSVTALTRAIWGPQPLAFEAPDWTMKVSTVAGASVPNSTFLAIGVALAVYTGLIMFLRFTRYGLTIRAGVENRAMVTALGIDIARCFAVVFSIGCGLAALAGVLMGNVYGVISPTQAMNFLIFGFVVLIIGGLGSIHGAALASVVVALMQQFANFYSSLSLGDFVVVMLLACVLLVRPSGLLRPGTA